MLAFLIESDEQALQFLDVLQCACRPSRPRRRLRPHLQRSRRLRLACGIVPLPVLGRLRLLFAVLVGALSGIGVITWELNEPFRGSFSITPAVRQLVVLQGVVDVALGE